MAENTKNVEFKNPHPELPVREPILKLGKMITDRAAIKLGLEKLTADDPEYWGLAAICTDEMAEVALKMGVRKPKTLPELVKITGMDEKYLEELLNKMAFNGVIEYNWENPKHEKQYVLPMFVPGSAEFANMNDTVLEEHPEMGRFFERMSRIPLEGLTHMVPPGGAGIGMHVIPVQKEVDMCNEAISLEKISYWLDKYEGKYAASPCSCRKSRKTFDEGCADDPADWCVAVGDMADYVVETGKGGRYITKEEALEIFKKAEDNGFVHQITNIDGEDKIFAICNCNVNVCYALRTSQLFNTPNMSRSAYVAHVNKQNCVACGRCVEYCPAGALSLGQKLCRKDGSEVTYPKMPLPSEQKWGRHMWSEDYRDKKFMKRHNIPTAQYETFDHNLRHQRHRGLRTNVSAGLHPLCDHGICPCAFHHFCHGNTCYNRNYGDACLFPHLHEFSRISGSCRHNFYALFHDHFCDFRSIWIQKHHVDSKRFIRQFFCFSDLFSDYFRWSTGCTDQSDSSCL